MVGSRYPVHIPQLQKQMTEQPAENSSSHPSARPPILIILTETSKQKLPSGNQTLQLKIHHL